MSTTIAFDVYGTLIDTQGVVSNLEQVIGDKATGFSHSWREKQLEYSFRRGLMQTYADFSVCTEQALNYTCQCYGISLDQTQRTKLLESYSSLPAFEDVLESLTKLREAGARLYAFSNGGAKAVDTLLNNAGLREFFDGIVSCDDLKTFKPNPEVYRYFLKESNSLETETWLVSSNSFDVIGAVSAGLRAAWVQRSKGQIFDPWGIEPTITVDTLCDLDSFL